MRVAVLPVAAAEHQPSSSTAVTALANAVGPFRSAVPRRASAVPASGEAMERVRKDFASLRVQDAECFGPDKQVLLCLGHTSCTATPCTFPSTSPSVHC